MIHAMNAAQPAFIPPSSYIPSSSRFKNPVCKLKSDDFSILSKKKKENKLKFIDIYWNVQNYYVIILSRIEK